jgi:hypothetical protein
VTYPCPFRERLNISSIYDEVPGETYRSILDPYRDSAAEIEKSDLDYTILRPGWFPHDKAVSYRITQKGEPFKGRFRIAGDPESPVRVFCAILGP